MRRLAMITLVLAAACAASDETVSTTGAPATGATAVTTTSPPTTATSPTSTIPVTTGMFPPTTLPGTIRLGQIPDDPGLPVAEPRSAIEWDRVGEGWVVFGFEALRPHGEMPTENALYLLGPDDRVYGIGTVSNGGVLTDVSGDGGTLLLLQDFAAYLVDLREATLTPVFERQNVIDITLDGSGDALLVSESVGEDRVAVGRVPIDGAEPQVLFEDVKPTDQTSPDFTWKGLTFLRLDDGGLATASQAGLILRDAGGTPIRELEQPGFGCEVVDEWDGDLLVSCLDPGLIGTECWDAWGPAAGRGLWLVDTGGDGAEPLYLPPVEPCPTVATTACRLGDRIAIELEACCECGGQLLTVTGDRAVPWDPGFTVCRPELIGARGDRLLVRELLVDDFWISALFAVDPVNGDARRLTPSEPGASGGVFGAVMVGEGT